jgi:hypothetical protein
MECVSIPVVAILPTARGGLMDRAPASRQGDAARNRYVENVRGVEAVYHAAVAKKIDRRSTRRWLGLASEFWDLECSKADRKVTLSLIVCTAWQRIVAALVQKMHFIAAKPLITNLHPRAERSQGGKVLDCKTNCFGRGGEPAIAERLAASTFELWHKQLGWRGVVECHWFAPRVEGVVPRSRARAKEG